MKQMAFKYLISTLAMSILGVVIVLPVLSQTFENEGNWEAFKRNRTIFGLTAGETPMNNVFKTMGNAQLSQPEDKHALSSVCFKSPDEKYFIVISTNYLHNTNTLYSFFMTIKPTQGIDTTCVESNQLKQYPKTVDGLSFHSTKANVLEKLGDPSSEDKNELRWDYRHYEKFDQPKISYAEAGPTDSRYLMKTSYTGYYHYPSITIRFEDNKVVYFEVGAWGESHFLIEHLPLGNN